jgi:hypothetical protein
MSLSEWVWVPVLVNLLVQVGLTAIAVRRIRRRDREHSARVAAAWDAEELRLRAFNAEADRLHGQVKATATRFRETFGIETLPPLRPGLNSLDPRNRVN